jgi:hypothetical protein
MTMEPATKNIENGKAYVFPMESAIATAILEGHGNNFNMGQVIKLTRESGKWSDQVLGESWTIKQWSEWYTNCSNKNEAYILVDVLLPRVMCETLCKNIPTQCLTSGGQYCLSYYTKKQQTHPDTCFKLLLAPPWLSQIIIHKGYSGLNISYFFVAQCSGTVKFSHYSSTDERATQNFTNIDSSGHYTINNSTEWDTLSQTWNTDKVVATEQISCGQAIIIPPRLFVSCEFCPEPTKPPAPVILITHVGDYLGSSISYADSVLRRYVRQHESSGEITDSEWTLFNILHDYYSLGKSSAGWLSEVHARAALPLCEAIYQEKGHLFKHANPSELPMNIRYSLSELKREFGEHSFTISQEVIDDYLEFKSSQRKGVLCLPVFIFRQLDELARHFVWLPNIFLSDFVVIPLYATG